MKTSDQGSIIDSVRTGLRDIWNAYMCEGADFSRNDNDIPFCPTTATAIPTALITWDEAKHLYKKAIARKDNNFFVDAFVCFYIDDHKFDGPFKGIWRNSKYAKKVLDHFSGIITPDFSTYQDFPYPLKLWNTYRMRAFGFWYGKEGKSVINNVRWGTPETWSYCFDGLPKHSMLCIGTVGGSPRKFIDRKRFEEGLEELISVLQPHTILVYGSANYSCFEKLREQGITVVSFPSHTASAFKKEGDAK